MGSEAGQIVIGLVLLVAVYILTRFGVAWKMRRAAIAIIKDLKRQEAIDPFSAVALPYDKVMFFRFGLRDYRPKALEALIFNNLVGRTGEGKYYLTEQGRAARVSPSDSEMETPG